MADGIYEWKRQGNQPFLVKLNGGGLFCSSGLWSTWISPEGTDVISYAIMTTEPKESMTVIHSRMPVILGYNDHERWLDTDADAAEVLEPCLSDWLVAYPVEKRVGNVLNNDKGLIRPL